MTEKNEKKINLTLKRLPSGPQAVAATSRIVGVAPTNATSPTTPTASRAPTTPSAPTHAIASIASSTLPAARSPLLPPVTRPEDAKVFILENKDHLTRILEEAGNKLVLIEFFATWCGPCKIIGPLLDDWAKTYYNRAVIIKIDVDDFEDVAMEYDVSGMPTMMFMRKKVKIGELVGSDLDKAKEAIEKYLVLSG